MAILTLRLDEQLKRKLQRLSKAAERPQSYFIKKALELYMEEYGDYRIALERRANKDEKTLSLSQMRKALGV